MILCSKLNCKFGLGGKYLENKDIQLMRRFAWGKKCNTNVSPLNLWYTKALQKVYCYCLLFFSFLCKQQGNTISTVFTDAREGGQDFCSVLCKTQFHALAWLSDWSIRWPHDESTCARETNMSVGLTTDKHSELATRWGPKGTEDAHNLLLTLVSASKCSSHGKICLVLNS